jgi:hypothetical protein
LTRAITTANGGLSAAEQQFAEYVRDAVQQLKT